MLYVFMHLLGDIQFYFLILYIHPHLCYRDNADDFIAAHRLSDMLVKINLDESASRTQGSTVGPLPLQIRSVHGHPSEIGTGGEKNVTFSCVSFTCENSC